jgi:C-terminal processing protease CtpA/Prc
MSFKGKLFLGYMHRSVLHAVAFFSIVAFCLQSTADVVILKNGKRLKGLILDEYKDRVVLSTADGEKTIMKSKIRSAVYDSEEDALIQKARNQLKKHQYVEAYYTYKKAVDLNPEHEEALERLNYLRGYLETKTRDDIIEGVRNNKERFAGADGRTVGRRVAEELGLVLGQGDKYAYVEEIVNDNLSGSASKLKPGDRIVRVWGEMTAYMTVDEVGVLLLSPGEVRFTVERTVSPLLRTAKSLFPWHSKIMGAHLRLIKKGIVIEKLRRGGPFAQVGILSGDLLCRINGKNTRYMPLSEVLGIIKKDQGRTIEIDVQRDVTLWRKE